MSNRSQNSTSSSNNRLRKPRPPRVTVPEPVHWLFRSNIPRRRASFIPASPGRRNFFGLGEIVGVVTNPASTMRSLTESKRLLEEARREIQETRERSQIRPTHTFSRLPGFFPRRAETHAIQRALEGEPSFTVLFGPPSAGKTALLREVLSHPRYHVLHFDLRIAGFADLESLYMSLSIQMEGFFEEIAQHSGWYEEGSNKIIEMRSDEIRGEGWDTFEREAWSFKHDRLNIQRRIGGSSGGGEGPAGRGEVRPSDIARLMELFQSSLLRYREFKPSECKARSRHNSQDTVVGSSQHGSSTKKQRGWFWGRKGKESMEHVSEKPIRESPAVDEDHNKNRKKRIPVIFFDEAHKLPHLIPSTQTMQTILDSTLVLTKQDRLCHVVHATSDPFYQGWLARVNVLWYCKMIAIGDLSKAEMRAYYAERVQPRLASLPPNIKRLDFDTLYDAFGGKVAHWYDFVTDHVNSGGMMNIKQCSHFLQAHALLNLHIIHSSQVSGGGLDSGSGAGNTTVGSIHGNPAANLSTEAHRASPETVLHPGLGPAGFRMYQSGGNGTHPNLNFMSTVAANPLIASFTPYDAIGNQPDFSPMQLLKVMSRFTSGGLTYLPYFHLCRELGARAVDAMIRGKVVDVKWTDSIPGVLDASIPPRPPPPPVHPEYAPSYPSHLTAHHAQERTLVEPSLAVEFGSNPPPPDHQPPPFTEDDEGDVMVAMSDDEVQAQQRQQQHSSSHLLAQHQQQTAHGSTASFNPLQYGGPPMDEGYHDDDTEEEEEEVIGPKIVPVSPIMRYAMREVVKEYEDDQSVSEYASLSDVDEY
ncbi:hypothetical protein FA15DRAFT_700030 [Coprinopsis marcescibilis]|uniref:AAA+ ATPase domain-containing protein n=1 Tax=Coprinopsis marcescibilis TaxID=230819 RepID=A0A5C3L9Y3_COPMA|nr:hypothetical protein FA15DRAFT_700030 [Coprinopsis marcescibilis]